MISALVTIALAYSAPAAKNGTGECIANDNCIDCIGQDYCAWCAPKDATYPDTTSAGRCFDARDQGAAHGGAPTCSPRTQTSECIIGYTCTGAPSYKCVSSGIPGEGTPDFADCANACGEFSSFKCNLAKSTCEVCSSGEPGCTAYDDCADACQSFDFFSCDVTNGTCAKCGPYDKGCVAKADCDSTCSRGYECDFPTDVTTDPTCKPCTKAPCAYASLDECNTGAIHTQSCAWKYSCDDSTNTCAKSQYGSDTKDQCDANCASGFTCESTSPTNGTCVASSGSKPDYTNMTDCMSACPNPPTNSTPYELRGVWRGLAIQNTFARGEWVANISEHFITMFMPGGDIFFKGTASTWMPSTQVAQLFVQSTEGKLVGDISIIYGDRQLEPEIQYVGLGLDSVNLATAPKDFDTAMVTAANFMLGMYKCADGAGSCAFTLPYTPAPPKPVLKATVADPCNAYPTCATCTGQKIGDEVCGWCTGAIYYNGTEVNATNGCSGLSGSSKPPWKCYGSWSAGTCPSFYKCGSSGCESTDDTSAYPDKATCDQACGPSPFSNCSFDGKYRGLQIDIAYVMGEWVFNLTKAGNASFEFMPTGEAFDGTMKCKEDPTVPNSGEYQLKLSNGTTFVGIYQTSSDQMETTGLTLGQSNVGGKSVPTDMDTAMSGTDSAVYGYTKCLSYKSGVCIF